MSLRALRFERGLTIQAVVEGSGVSKATVIRLEAGTGSPTAPTAKALADFYEVPVAEIVHLADLESAA